MKVVLLVNSIQEKKKMKEYTNYEAYNLLNELWDNYHLKKVSEGVIKQVEKLVDMLSSINEEQWIINFIEKYCY